MPSCSHATQQRIAGAMFRLGYDLHTSRKATMEFAGTDDLGEVPEAEAHRFCLMLERQVRHNKANPKATAEGEAETGEALADQLEMADQRKVAEIDFATLGQLKRIKFHAIPVGIHYVKTRDLGMVIGVGGEIVQGEELREWMRLRWAKIKRSDDPLRLIDAPIPPAQLSRIYTNVINPMGNRFLVEGNFKNYTLNAKRLFFNQLTKAEALYLIDRYREVHETLTRQDIETLPPIIS